MTLIDVNGLPEPDDVHAAEVPFAITVAVDQDNDDKIKMVTIAIISTRFADDINGQHFSLTLFNSSDERLKQFTLIIIAQMAKNISHYAKLVQVSLALQLQLPLSPAFCVPRPD